MPRPERRDYYFEPTSTSGYSSPDRYRDPLAAPPAPAPPPPLPPKQPWYRGAPALIAAGKHVGHHDFERACVSVAVEQPARVPEPSITQRCDGRRHRNGTGNNGSRGAAGHGHRHADTDSDTDAERDRDRDPDDQPAGNQHGHSDTDADRHRRAHPRPVLPATHGSIGANQRGVNPAARYAASMYAMFSTASAKSSGSGAPCST
jgi:hypothetical protein